MAEKIFTPDERKQFEELAHRRGFNSLRRYVQMLIEQDAQKHGESVAIKTDDELNDPVESFRAGLAQALQGDVLTEEEFWKAVSEDE